jgi:uncharacterized protein DUF3311
MERGARVSGASAGGRRAGRWWIYLLLLPPFPALLYPPLYARHDPELFGFPFFYWWQFAWVIIGAGLTAIVYLVTRGVDTDEEPER